MAVQLHVAHSALVKGVGAIAAGPYYCAQGSLWTGYSRCMTPSFLAPLPSIAFLKNATEILARERRIDPTANLAAARVWLFTGRKDQTVSAEVVEALLAFYSGYQARTIIVRHERAGHAMVTESAGDPECGATRPPFINDCDYDTAGELLKHLLGPLVAPAPQPDGRLLAFDQKPYGGHDISMDDEGYVYIPKECEARHCRVHVAFHGCRQGRAVIQDRFAREAGYNRWADTNRIIVLYPQAISRLLGVYNPRGCWDWWGYTGPQYHTREGAQIRAVKAMLDRLSAPRK